jgi:hypothetical protein
MTNPHHRHRRPAVPYRRGLSFKLLVTGLGRLQLPTEAEHRCRLVIMALYRIQQAPANPLWGRLFVGTAALAGVAGCSERTVNRTFDDLVKTNAIEIHQRTGHPRHGKGMGGMTLDENGRAVRAAKGIQLGSAFARSPTRRDVENAKRAELATRNPPGRLAAAYDAAVAARELATRAPP